MAKIMTRYGDGTPVKMSADDIRQDLEEGTADAADRGGIPALNQVELDHLFDIFSSPHRFVGVEPGREVVRVVRGYVMGDTPMPRSNNNLQKENSCYNYPKYWLKLPVGPWSVSWRSAFPG